MACPGASRLVGLLRRADERAGDHGVPAPSGRSLAPRHQAAGTEASARMAANEGNRQSLPAISAHPASVARTTVSKGLSQAASARSTGVVAVCFGSERMAVICAFRLLPRGRPCGPRGYFGGQSLSVGKTNGMTILGSPTGFASGSTGSAVLSPLPGVAKREGAA